MRKQQAGPGQGGEGEREGGKIIITSAKANFERDAGLFLVCGWRRLLTTEGREGKNEEKPKMEWNQQ